MAGGACSFDIQCEDGDPCTTDACAIEPGAPAGSGTCSNAAVPDGGAGGCDDRLFCNGREVCNASGACETRNAPDCPAIALVCDEQANQCIDPCTADVECDDGLKCTGTELCGTDGACQPGSNPCGPEAACREGICDPSGLPCAADRDCPSGETCRLDLGPGCYLGRCCTGPDFRTCDDERFSDCEGLWYATDEGRVSGLFQNSCEFASLPDQGCPQYSSGIAPFGEFPVEVGPASQSPVAIPTPNGPGQPLRSIGDDYHLGGSGLFALAVFRWIGGTDTDDSYVRISVYDTQGRFIADRLMHQPAAGVVRRTVRFDPPIIVPADGFIVARVDAVRSPNARLFWSSTEAVDVGFNDPDILVFNDCQRDCDPSDCTSFLDPHPGVLAFELLADPVAAGDEPTGACCRGLPGECMDGVLAWECREGVCNGGDNDCEACTDASDCPGGTCDAGVYLGEGTTCGTCSADSVNPGDACQSDTECSGGICDFPCEVGACCLADGTCLPGKTESECDAQQGTLQGLGTDCDSNCCPQPVLSGADDCQDAPLVPITVPEAPVCAATGAPCVTDADCPGSTCAFTRVVTITGDNSSASATSDDPDFCFGVADGPADDRGWWEGFSFSTGTCAFVRIDLCCTDPPREIDNTVLYRDCQCPLPISPIVNLSAWGLDEHPAAAPCADGNLSGWFGPLRPGNYYYPVFSSLSAPGGPYQLHITLEPCPVAACCNGTECSESNYLDCEDGGGRYIGPPNKFPAEPACVPNSDDCDPFDGSNCGTCQTGSCCSPTIGTPQGPGTCRDQFGVDMMTEGGCLSAGGTFVGGIRCQGGQCGATNRSCGSDAECSGLASPNDVCTGTSQQLTQPTPCPLCDIKAPQQCHALTASIANLSVSELTLDRQTVLDDFVPSGDTLTTLCTSGVYFSTLPHDIDDTLGCRQRTAYPMPDPIDKFLVRVFADDDGRPGAEVGRAYASSTGNAWGSETNGHPEGTVARKANLSGPNSRFFCPFPNSCELTDEDYQIEFAPGGEISGLVTDGRRYWISIMNNMDESPVDPSDNLPSCIWLINHSEEGNQYAFTGTESSFQPVSKDLAFCLDFPFYEPPGAIGACCGCLEETCVDDIPMSACTGPGEQWFFEQTCADLIGSYLCSLGPPVNDTCATPLEIGPGRDIDGDPAAGTFTFQTNHACADSELADLLLCSDFDEPCDGCGQGSFIGNDLWYTYMPPADGIVTVDTCLTGTSWDSMLAIYKGADGTGACPCPTDVASCNEAAFVDNEGQLASDEACSPTLGTGGRLRREVKADTCYLLQIGSWGTTTTSPGVGQVSIRFATVISDCVAPPSCPNEFRQVTGGNAGGRLNRFGCFEVCPELAGYPHIYKVAIDTMYNTLPDQPPAQCPAGRTKPSLSQFGGQVRYLGMPADFVDNSSPGQPNYIAAPLVCTPEEAAVLDWTPDGLQVMFGADANVERIYFYGPEVAPCSAYEVSPCENPAIGSGCGDATLVYTAKHGDAWHPFGADQPNVVDITKLVDKFRGIPFVPNDGTPTGAPREVRALLRGNVVGNLVNDPDAVINVTDITIAVDAFRGRPYAEQGPCGPDGFDTCGRPCDPSPGD